MKRLSSDVRKIQWVCYLFSDNSRPHFRILVWKDVHWFLILLDSADGYCWEKALPLKNSVQNDSSWRRVIQICCRKVSFKKMRCFNATQMQDCAWAPGGSCIAAWWWSDTGVSFTHEVIYRMTKQTLHFWLLLHIETHSVCASYLYLEELMLLE